MCRGGANNLCPVVKYSLVQQLTTLVQTLMSTRDRWTTDKEKASFTAITHFHGNALSGWHRAEDSLFGHLGTGLKKEAVEGRVLVGEVRGRSGVLEVQAADDDVQHGGHCCQLHAVKHGWQLWRDGVYIWLVGVHDYSEKQKQCNTFLSILCLARNEWVYIYIFLFSYLLYIIFIVLYIYIFTYLIFPNTTNQLIKDEFTTIWKNKTK